MFKIILNNQLSIVGVRSALKELYALKNNDLI